ncbi:hypothetical protein M404DRAFT_1009419 [Pisolithus tinctorius Marx 270]|uniref:Uncharacterized protein n=1 Tax=Pisolithus tinctorius Marx 270 TaxID=870435 RepID=A0A0C3NAV6_PISTI|nr:hypothetical protein M404DRAFT_1009419 [Pisolithus tinctorius Marx 270]
MLPTKKTGLSEELTSVEDHRQTISSAQNRGHTKCLGDSSYYECMVTAWGVHGQGLRGVKVMGKHSLKGIQG